MTVVALDATGAGNGRVSTFSAEGKDLVSLDANLNGGRVWTYSFEGKPLAVLSGDDDGGFVHNYSPEGKPLVALGGTKYGGVDSPGEDQQPLIWT